MAMHVTVGGSGVVHHGTVGGGGVGDVLLCAKCHSTPAARCCPQCQLVYCKPCADKRHSKGAYRRHTVADLPVCDECEEAPSALQCADCELNLCLKCSKDLHASGSMQDHESGGKFTWHDFRQGPAAAQTSSSPLAPAVDTTTWRLNTASSSSSGGAGAGAGAGSAHAAGVAMGTTTGFATAASPAAVAVSATSPSVASPARAVASNVATSPGLPPQVPKLSGMDKWRETFQPIVGKPKLDADDDAKYRTWGGWELLRTPRSPVVPLPAAPQRPNDGQGTWNGHSTRVGLTAGSLVHPRDKYQTDGALPTFRNASHPPRPPASTGALRRSNSGDHTSPRDQSAGRLPRPPPPGLSFTATRTAEQLTTAVSLPLTSTDSTTPTPTAGGQQQHTISAGPGVRMFGRSSTIGAPTSSHRRASGGLLLRSQMARAEAFASATQRAGRGRGSRGGQGSTPRHQNSNEKRGGRSKLPLVLENVMSGADTRTTLMIRNIPNKYNQQMVLAEIDESHWGTYDFFYLPIDFKNRCNVGYAFINMIDFRDIVTLHQRFNTRKWNRFNSEKKCALSYARIQTKQSLIDRFQNSTLLDKDPACRPLLFHTSGPAKGTPLGFPLGRSASFGGAPTSSDSGSSKTSSGGAAGGGSGGGDSSTGAMPLLRRNTSADSHASAATTGSAAANWKWDRSASSMSAGGGSVSATSTPTASVPHATKTGAGASAMSPSSPRGTGMGAGLGAVSDSTSMSSNHSMRRFSKSTSSTSTNSSSGSGRGGVTYARGPPAS